MTRRAGSDTPLAEARPEGPGGALGKSERTRARILEAALDLFNREGVSRVSCNRIAQAAGISPGNLYYHFPNKSGVIAAIWDAIAAEVDALWMERASTVTSVEGQLNLGRLWVAILWRYRFFFIDLVAILREDDDLRRAYIAKRNEALDVLTGMLTDYLAARGLSDRVEPGLIRQIATNYWIVSVKIIDFQMIDKRREELDEDFIAFGVDQVSALVHAMELAARQA